MSKKHPDPVGEVKEAVMLAPDELRMVAAGTAARLLGINVPLTAEMCMP
jgi:hypothetical protein